MMNRVVFVTIVIILSLNMTVSYASEIDHKKQDNDDLIWVKLEKLSRAQELINIGDNNKAKIVLEGMMEKYPDYEEAESLYEKLKNEETASLSTPYDSDRKIADLANGYWQEYKKFKSSGELGKAYKEIQKINALYDGSDSKPLFLSGLEAEVENLKLKIDFLIGSKIRAVQGELKTIGQIEDAGQRLTKTVGVYESVQNLLKNYEGLKKVKQLNSRIVDLVNKSARVVFAKHMVSKRLEGCDGAEGGLEEMLKILKFPEFDYYKEVEKEIAKCEG